MRGSADAVTERELDQIRKAARRMYVESRAEQGLPPHLTDPETIEQVAAILRPVPISIRRAA